MTMHYQSSAEKFNTVISKNTFYFFNPIFEEKYESYLNSIRETLLVLKNEIENEGLQKAQFERLLVEKENGLRALLALTGFSNEYLKRLITVIRVVDDPELAKLILKDWWAEEELTEEIKEWSDKKIQKMIVSNEYFRKGIVNLFFEGATIPFLVNTIPLFELKKLSISKLKFDIPSMIDTLIRYKEKGSYSGMLERNPESVIKVILTVNKITFEKGKLGKTPRMLDFIIPNTTSPRIIIECSYEVTTASGMGDKAKTEKTVADHLKKNYPNVIFVGFVDGIGWYVRKGDLKRMVQAYDFVFTFSKYEIERFERLVLNLMEGK